MLVLCDSLAIDENGGLAGGWVVCAHDVDPAVRFNDAFGGSSINGFVEVPLEKSNLEDWTGEL